MPSIMPLCRRVQLLYNETHRIPTNQLTCHLRRRRRRRRHSGYQKREK